MRGCGRRKGRYSVHAFVRQVAAAKGLGIDKKSEYEDEAPRSQDTRSLLLGE